MSVAASLPRLRQPVGTVEVDDGEGHLRAAGVNVAAETDAGHFAALIESTLIVLVLTSSVPLTFTLCPANFSGVR